MLAELGTGFPDLLKEYAPTISALVASLVALGALLFFFGKRLMALFGVIKSRLDGRIRSQPVCKVRSKAFDDFVEVYHSTFGPGERVATEEIEDWVSSKARTYEGSYRPFVCYAEGKPAGFAIVWGNVDSDIVFIAFLGIAPGAGNWTVSRKIIESLKSAVLKHFPQWKVLVTEMESPTETGIPDDERRRRNARIRHFRSLAKASGLRLACPRFGYSQPRYLTDEEDDPAKCMQLHVVLRNGGGSSIDRAELMRCLRFLYLGVYLPFAPRSVTDPDAYEQRLEEELRQYQRSLDPLVPFEA